MTSAEQRENARSTQRRDAMGAVIVFLAWSDSSARRLAAARDYSELRRSFPLSVRLSFSRCIVPAELPCAVPLRAPVTRAHYTHEALY